MKRQFLTPFFNHYVMTFLPTHCRCMGNDLIKGMYQSLSSCQICPLISRSHYALQQLKGISEHLIQKQSSTSLQYVRLIIFIRYLFYELSLRHPQGQTYLCYSNHSQLLSQGQMFSLSVSSTRVLKQWQGLIQCRNIAYQF